MSESPRSLFQDVTPENARLMDLVQKLTVKVLDLKPKHAHTLPRSIESLSTALTSERGDLKPGYLQEPRNAAAYLSYFLPWNLYRLSRLLPTLELDWQDGAVIVDVGAGPLTMPLALWISRPDLRQRKLNFICIDRAKRPLQQGRALFEALLTELGEDPTIWRFRLAAGPLEKELGNVKQRVHAITIANTLNEMHATKRISREEVIEGLAQRMCLMLRREKGASILSVEPGTRLGAAVVTQFRQAAVDAGLTPAAPCTHDEECPLLGRQPKGWCHFTFQVKSASPALQQLSRAAGLGKPDASLSFAHLIGDHEIKPGWARAISHPFQLEGDTQRGQYCCTSHGWALYKTAIIDAKSPGDVIKYEVEPSGGRDAKSGAVLIRQRRADKEEN